MGWAKGVRNLVTNGQTRATHSTDPPKQKKSLSHSFAQVFSHPGIHFAASFAGSLIHYLVHTLFPSYIHLALVQKHKLVRDSLAHAISQVLLTSSLLHSLVNSHQGHSMDLKFTL